MKKFKVVYMEDPYDEWGRPVPYSVDYILAENKKEIPACFSKEELKELDVQIYTEKEAIAIAKKNLADTIKELKRAKGNTLDEMGWDPV